MSYSFSIVAATKALALVAVAAEFDKVVASQPIHARDREAVLKNADAVVSLLADDDTKDVAVSCNGYVSWTGEGNLCNASVSASAGLSPRKQPAA